MAKTHKSLLRTILSAAAGCGCGRPKTLDSYQPIPVQKIVKTNGGGGEEDGVNTPTAAADTSASSYTQPCLDQPDDDPNPKIADSVAVLQDSEDPYRDFRDSMLQMISEKELESRDELEELLNCFLEINSPCHYDVIFRAFSDVCNHMDESGRVVRTSTCLPTE